MKRDSQIPYEEISLLSLASISSETKFQVLSKVKDQSQDYLLLSDDTSEFSFSTTDFECPDLEIGDVVMVFGQKKESDIELDKIIKMNLDWSLLIKTRNVEQL